MTESFLSEQGWAGIRVPVDRASALPAVCYTNQAFFDLEQARVFRRGWVGVGFADEVKGPGAAIVREIGNQSVLITKNRNNELRAFANSCRHRGTELVESDCTVNGIIRCPYHRWGYNLDGVLVATPRFDEVPLQEFDPAQHGLRSFMVDTFAGVIWVSLDSDAPTLSTCLGDLPARLAGYRPDRWRLAETASLRVEANWKLISENFQEYYHLPWVHPELSKVSRVADHYRFQGPGLYCGQTTTPVSNDERDDWSTMPAAAYLDKSDRSSGRFIAMFPNVVLAVLPNHSFVIILEPRSPGLTLERTGLLVPETEASPSSEALDATSSFWTEVNNEDIDIVQRGQRGLTKGGYQPGRLSPRFEEPLHRFYNMLADKFVGIERIPEGDPSDEVSLYGSGVNPLPYKPQS